MRVKLQLVLCSDDGHEETVTDVCNGAKEVRICCFKPESKPEPRMGHRVQALVSRYRCRRTG
jgi:hypothetical protein